MTYVFRLTMDTEIEAGSEQEARILLENMSVATWDFKCVLLRTEAAL